MIEQLRLRRFLELLPERLLCLMALQLAEMQAGVSRTLREIGEDLCGPPQLGDLDEPFAAKYTLK